MRETMRNWVSTLSSRSADLEIDIWVKGGQVSVFVKRIPDTCPLNPQLRDSARTMSSRRRRVLGERNQRKEAREVLVHYEPPYQLIRTDPVAIEQTF